MRLMSGDAFDAFVLKHGALPEHFGTLAYGNDGGDNSVPPNQVALLKSTMDKKHTNSGSDSAVLSCQFARGTGKTRLAPPPDSQLPGCPGAEYLYLCPEGNYCPNPINRLRCPAGSYCPLGSEEPVRCPAFLHMCDEAGLARPIEVCLTLHSAISAIVCFPLMFSNFP